MHRECITKVPSRGTVEHIERAYIYNAIGSAALGLHDAKIN